MSSSIKKRSPRKKVFLILGTSSTGKSSLINKYILPNVPNSISISADEIFDELLKTAPLGIPSKELKPLVLPLMIQHIQDVKHKKVFVDHVDIELLSYDIPNRHTILIYTPLRQLAKQASVRTSSEGRRPLDGVLRQFSNFYTCEPNDESVLVDTISKEDILDFLTLDKYGLTSLKREKAFKKACRKMKIKSEKRLSLYTRYSFDTVINTQGLKSAEVYEKLSHLF